MKSAILFLLFIAGVYLTYVRAEEMTPIRSNTSTSRVDKARKDAAKLKLPVNRFAKEAQKAAEKTAAIFHSPGFQKRLECEQKRLAQGILKTYSNPWQKQEPAQEQFGNLAATEKVYLFISSSVPVGTIQPYISAIAKLGDPNVIPVMRGFIKGMADLQASTEFFNTVIQKDPECRDEIHPQKICERFKVEISVNPLLFSQHGITVVPAVVYVNAEDSFIIEGDAALDSLLEQINREAKSATLASMITKMRGKS